MAGESFSLVCFDFFLFILAAEIAEEEEEDGETVRQSADQSTSLVGLHNPFVYPSGERIGNQPAVAGGAFPPSISRGLVIFMFFLNFFVPNR